MPRRSSSGSSTTTARARSTASRCPSTPTRCGTAICRTRGRACSTAIASTAPTIPRTAIASITTSCCSIPTPRRCTARCAGRDAHFGYRVGSPREDLSFDRRDNARGMPKCVLVDPAFTLGRRPPARRRHGTDTIIYEVHVRGFTMQRQDVPAPLRGTFAGFCAPAGDRPSDRGSASPRSSCCRSTPSVDDRHLVEQGPAQLLGLQHDRLLRAAAALSRRAARSPSSRPWSRGCTMPGSRCILDVVYNHTAEGNHLGPTLVLPRHRQRVLLPAAAGQRALLRGFHRHAATRSTSSIRACCRW